jgi:excisionase family DNA binding protein
MESNHSDVTSEQLAGLSKHSTSAEPVRPPSPWMGPQEAAGYLGIALGTLRNWTSARFIPFSKRGGVVRYNREVIDRWLSKGSCPGRTSLADL